MGIWNLKESPTTVWRPIRLSHSTTKSEEVGEKRRESPWICFGSYFTLDVPRLIDKSSQLMFFLDNPNSTYLSFPVFLQQSLEFSRCSTFLWVTTADFLSEWKSIKQRTVPGCHGETYRFGLWPNSWLKSETPLYIFVIQEFESSTIPNRVYRILSIRFIHYLIRV